MIMFNDGQLDEKEATKNLDLPRALHESRFGLFRNSRPLNFSSALV